MHHCSDPKLNWGYEPMLGEKTLLIDALAADETMFDRLVAGHSVYRRFASVLMREDTAGRLTIADIANMAAVPVAAVVNIARSCGPAPASDEHTAHAPLPEGRPAWLDKSAQEKKCFDARPLLQAGYEPLPDLLDFADTASLTAVLVIETTFHAEPLRRLFEGRGYQSAAEAQATDHWRIYLRKPQAIASSLCE